MNTAERRWLVRIPTVDEWAWELAQTELLGEPVEAIIELDGVAEVYFVERSDAERVASIMGLATPELSLPGGGEVFGETLHPTTELCLELIAVVASSGDCVLDVGSGTGRLAAKALDCGARIAVAVDVDWPAAKASRALVSDVVQGSADCVHSDAFDLVLANLHLAAWRAVAGDIGRVSRAQARLVASGCLAEQEPEAVALLQQNGWNVDEVRSREGWIAITARRIEM